MKFRSIALGLGLAFGLMAAAGAQTVMRINISTAQNSHQGVAIDVFAKEVEKRTNGRYKIQTFYNGSLGGERESIEAVQLGTHELTFTSTGPVPNFVPETKILDVPFLFRDKAHARAVLDGPIGQEMLTKFDAKGMKGLAWAENGFRNMTNSRRPITKLEDVEGLKIRVIASPIYLELFKTLGANPVPMTFGEVYGALESKAIDGQDNPVGVIESAKFAEVQKYMSMTRHVYTGMPFLMSKKTWDSMSPAERKIITDAAAEAKTVERQISQQKEAQAIDGLRKTMQVNEVSPAELARLRQKVQPAIDKFTKEVGEPVVKEVNAELARLRAPTK